MTVIDWSPCAVRVRWRASSYGTLAGVRVSEDAMVLEAASAVQSAGTGRIDVLRAAVAACDATTRKERCVGMSEQPPDERVGTELRRHVSHGGYLLTGGGEPSTFSILRRGLPHPPTPLLIKRCRECGPSR